MDLDRVAVVSSLLPLVLGGLAAYGLRRGSFAGRDWAEGNFMAPLIVPTIIVAIALYLGWPRSACSARCSASCWRTPCSTCRWS